ncbi:MAG TPA: insulinase family protein, partial [Pyrinomonadaceae bacterium]|nr:insulinase family protein [Pyrinomonadaceae bacterium]
MGQNPVEPRREQLLNGLKVLVWSEPKSEKITVKLRVHSGSTFDPAGKSGVMRLLAENLFPDAGTREFFEEELGGSLEVESNYDFIEINASGKASEFERILDIIRTAVITPPIAPDTFKKVLDARLKAAQEESKNPSVIADLEIRKRLFGDFPYGRAENGTPESLAKIAHFDLIGARDKFLTADNSTLVIIGNVREAYAVRAAKQLFGSWRKADKLIPPTFRQPEPVDPKILVVDMPGAGTSEIRLAVRGLARNDKDLMAANFWTGIMEARIRAGMPANLQKRFSLRHTTNALPGIFIISASVPTEKTGETLKSLREQI